MRERTDAELLRRAAHYTAERDASSRSFPVATPPFWQTLYHVALPSSVISRAPLTGALIFVTFALALAFDTSWVTSLLVVLAIVVPTRVFSTLASRRRRRATQSITKPLWDEVYREAATYPGAGEDALTDGVIDARAE